MDKEREGVGQMDRHPLAGKVVTLKLASDKDADGINGRPYAIEDWWVNVAGRSWMDCDGNPACLIYAARSACAGLPTDNQVLYGKVGSLGHLIHESELGEVIEAH